MKQFWSTADLASWLHGSASHSRKVVALLKAYFDESGTHNRSAVVCIAGFVGTCDSWQKMESDWLELLGEFQPYGVRYFHTSELLAQEGQFAHIDKPKGNYFFKQAAKIIRDAGVSPVFSAAVRHDWEQTVGDEVFLERFPEPFYLCFEDVMQTLRNWTKRQNINEKVAPMFASSPNYSAQMQKIGKACQSKSWYADHLGTIAFGSMEDHIPLQAADYLAHQMCWEIEKNHGVVTGMRKPSGRTEALHLMTSKAITGHWFYGDHLESVVRQFKLTGEI